MDEATAKALRAPYIPITGRNAGIEHICHEAGDLVQCQERRTSNLTLLEAFRAGKIHGIAIDSIGRPIGRRAEDRRERRSITVAKPRKYEPYTPHWKYRRKPK